MSDADDLFGTTPVPGEAVKHRDFDPAAPYRPRPRFRYRADGRPYPIDEPLDTRETELPREDCPDGSPRCARRDGRD
jgi:hypothetical protein